MNPYGYNVGDKVQWQLMGEEDKNPRLKMIGNIDAIAIDSIRSVD